MNNNISKKYVLGVNGSFHDSSVALLALEDKHPTLICSEDRHSGQSHHFGFPWASFKTILNTIDTRDILAVGYSRDRFCFRNPPSTYFSDILSLEYDVIVRSELQELCDIIDSVYPDTSYLPALVSKILKKAEKDTLDVVGLKKRLNYILVKYINELLTESEIAKFLPNCPIIGLNHHKTHAATYLCSDYEHAAIITWDGRGEFDTTVLWEGRGDEIIRIEEILHPNSLGAFYEMFSEYVGFDRITGPGKLMGLASYGDSRFLDIVSELIVTNKSKFDIKFNPDFLSFSQSERLAVRSGLEDIIGSPRQNDERLNDRHKAIAFAVQHTLENVAFKLIDYAKKKLKTENFVFSGGVALNCILNERIRQHCGVDIFLLPPCGDDGTSLGAAILLKQKYADEKNKKVVYKDTYGTRNSKNEVREYLKKNEFIFSEASPSDVAKLIHKNEIIGYMEGRYEFGPRALCFRSILANPTYFENWDKINSEVKYREDFRPFAPVMLVETAKVLWGNETKPVESPYMLLAPRMNIRAKELIPAVVHVDMTSRLQTIAKEYNPFIYHLVKEFGSLSGYACLLNTSLNMAGESIIADFEELLEFLAISNMDAVVIEGFLIHKTDNIQKLNHLKEAIGDRKSYLDRRKIKYRDFLRENYFGSEYYSIDDFFSFLFDQS